MYLDLPKSFLVYGGDVIFPVVENGVAVNLKYIVLSSYLAIRGGFNGKVLRAIGLDADQVDKFLTEVYGYRPMGGGWPEFNDGDYEAANRAIWGIYNEILKQAGMELKDPDLLINPEDYLSGLKDLLKGRMGEDHRLKNLVIETYSRNIGHDLRKLL